MKVIGYIRVSTEEQATDGVSLAAQREKLIAYASLYELDLVEIIEDAGQSGKTLDRPGLQRALSMIRKGQAAGLLIAKLDRLSRSVVDWNELIDGYFGEKAGKQIFSVADSIDTRTAAGRLVLNVLMSVAQWERETIGERTKDALQHKIRKGERCGKVRFGYHLADDGTTLIEDPAEQEALQAIRRLKAAGQSLREIAAEMTRRGIATKEGNAQWKHTTIARILQRTA
jgi:DNA invertase Pin-like site-specific DNA recombinase